MASKVGANRAWVARVILSARSAGIWTATVWRSGAGAVSRTFQFGRPIRRPEVVGRNASSGRLYRPCRIVFSMVDAMENTGSPAALVTHPRSSARLASSRDERGRPSSTSSLYAAS